MPQNKIYEYTCDRSMGLSDCLETKVWIVES